MAASNVALHPDDPPEYPDLHASKQKLRDVLNTSYWQQLCPSLHVTDTAFMATMKSFQLPEARLDDLTKQINHAGVAQVASPELPWSVSPDILANAIVTLMRYGWPPSLIIIYDEVWSLIEQAGMLMNKATGGNACNMDVLAWYVDPNKGHVGFSPHRDRQPDDSPATFRPDGTPMYATLWLALTDATPENSCLYVLPRYADPGYYAGDPDDEDAPDPLSTALYDKEAYQNIRALPAPTGSAAIFTHRTIHWGSKGRPGYPTPRISISWGCADDDFEAAYFSRTYLPCPPLELRMALAGAQMIVYHERFPAPPKQLALYYQAFTAQADNFDSGYRSKVMREFIDGSKEATAAAAAAARPTSVDAAAALASGSVAAGVNESNRRTRSSRSRTKSTTAAAANGTQNAPTAVAAAAGASGGSRPVSGKRRKCNTGTASATPAVAAAATEDEDSRPKKRQKEGLEKGLKTTAVKGQAAAAAAEVQQSDKKQPTKQASPAATAAVAAAAAAPDQSPAAAAAAAVESEDSDDGIDWAAVTTAAQKRAPKEQRRRKKHTGGGMGTAASSSSSSSGDSDACDDDSDGDVMDLALDSMLDAALAGQDNLQDDYEDE